VAESAVLYARGDVVLVRQIHLATSMTDREVVVEWQVERLEDGYRYRWRKAEHQVVGESQTRLSRRRGPV
jgi:hypothetical protein